MSDVIKHPTHYRLMSALKAIGPYFRELQSSEGHYLFDCLSFCIDEKKLPEEREFWGWWLELDKVDGGFAAKYYVGMYDDVGDWKAKKVPKKVVVEVQRTQKDFHKKLLDTLQRSFNLQVHIHEESVEFV
ncbi:sigma factor-binding protein Crl [Vibrio profundum]|uniref:sigma factor-binding protein Crl n=1 Tax=Vibrio profundum TaxID=2910247 RepID=UPI003D0CC3B4